MSTRRYTMHLGDCIDVLPSLPLVDSIVTDPPAGVAFMGAEWDQDHGGREAWVAWLAARLRAARERLRPGGHALVWALPRTSHWTACAIEDAGFEVRDFITAINGQGFPKNLNVTKAINDRFDTCRCRRNAVQRARKSGAVAGQREPQGGGAWPTCERCGLPVAPDGLGTALKPAVEFWILARNPLSAPTVAENVMAHGTGALQVDACRVGYEGERDKAHRLDWSARYGGKQHGTWADEGATYGGALNTGGGVSSSAGRWPPHLLLSHAEDCTAAACSAACPVRALGEQSGERASGARNGGRADISHTGYGSIQLGGACEASTGTAARFFPQFFYASKASRAERERGLEGRERRRSHSTQRTEVLVCACGNKTLGDTWPTCPRCGADMRDGTREERHGLVAANHHPTVKPLALMRWLVRLVTPPGGLVLDPFAGSGSTGCAAILEGMQFAGIEQDADYLEIARARIAHYADPFAPMRAAAQPDYAAIVAARIAEYAEAAQLPLVLEEAA